jgi:hypothetical protein
VTATARRLDMKRALQYTAVRTSRAFDDLLGALYMKAKRDPEEIVVPPLRVISVRGNEPPASQQFQRAIAVLYGIGYGLKMGLKFEKLPRPRGYFDYRVGALGAFWASTRGGLDIDDAASLRWQAYLIVPAFVSKRLFEDARAQATEKHPEIPYDSATFEVLREGRAVQVLHVGPYDQEQPTVERIHRYLDAHGLVVKGRHHEIYISDPRRTSPAKLKTVIRFAVAKRTAAR